MSFSQFMMDVPGWARLLLALALSVGISLAAVTVFHRRMLHLDDRNEEEAEAAEEAAKAAEEAGEPAPPRFVKTPETVFLAQRVLGLTATAFVFLLAFTIGNFWGNANDARSATLDETTSYGRAVSAARTLTAAQQGPEVIAALASYRSAVTDVEWPLLQRGDGDAAFAVQFQAAADLGAAAMRAEDAGAGSASGWGLLTDSINDMTADGTSRIAQVPSSFAPGILWAIGILGLANLVISAVFQPARLGPNLLLIGVMAAITALLMFVAVETSNPFVGGGAVTPPTIAQPE